MGYQATYDIKFTLEPFLKLTHEKMINIKNGSKIKNIGFIDSEPIIKLTLPNDPQNIQIDINGDVFQINQARGVIEIDTALFRVAGEERFKTIGNWPALKKGVNIISWTGNITKFEILPNFLFRG